MGARQFIKSRPLQRRRHVGRVVGRIWQGRHILVGAIADDQRPQKLAERTNAQVIIENRPGAGGIVAANAVISSEPDGYTLFVFSSGIALSKSLLKTMPFDPVTAFSPISTMALFDLLLLVKADSTIHTLKDALVDPKKFNVGTINPGSTQNVTGELLRSATAFR